MDAEKGTQQKNEVGVVGHAYARLFLRALEMRRERGAGRICLGCGAKTDERGALPCGH
ncbi:hypothetical protein R77569_04536 [Ralstonia mannitolilytica]|uniref:Uncharacterized protein n=1 Tax=Ralstonia mannitolilytica TaxID=105219 RepID=A0ABN9KI44_9RALS|nr:hypothetical protein [Ralstonia mannitolilytica]CAJ0895817.1 hypothetical protein R77569_04536 [Ralstonia mannitolilytica]